MKELYVPLLQEKVKNKIVTLEGAEVWIEKTIKHTKS